MLRSGLALAGANTWLARGALPDGAEDALFTVEDVSGLDLLSTDLVVLSACESGLGDVQTGEGVFGLQRAFLLAGAKTLLMSLWSVPDAQTQILMQDFYQRLLAGSLRAEALRDAQLALKASDPHPADWGAFVCLGDPRPLPAPSSPAQGGNHQRKASDIQPLLAGHQIAAAQTTAGLSSLKAGRRSRPRRNGSTADRRGASDHS